MPRLALRFALVSGLLPLTLAGCSQGYSPNTYASSAAQVQATVERGVIIGVRQVMISANGTVGAATGGAIGGVAGSQIPGNTVTTALGAIGGTLVGGIGGTAAAEAVGNAKGWEYIIQEDGNKLVSVTQTSKVPLAIGQHVLVIAGTQQARIVPDYTVQIPAPAPPKPPATPGIPTPAEINLNPLPPLGGELTPLQVAPINAANASGSASPPAANPAAATPATTAAAGSTAAPAQTKPTPSAQAVPSTTTTQPASAPAQATPSTAATTPPASSTTP